MLEISYSNFHVHIFMQLKKPSRNVAQCSLLKGKGASIGIACIILKFFRSVTQLNGSLKLLFEIIVHSLFYCII